MFKTIIVVPDSLKFHSYSIGAKINSQNNVRGILCAISGNGAKWISYVITYHIL